MPWDPMVTLTTFSNPIEAELARNRLEAEGIQAFLSGETANSMFGAALGLTIALQVRQADAERADRVLAELPRMGDTRRDFLADAARASGMEENEDSTAIEAPEWADEGPIDENDPEARYRTTSKDAQSAPPARREERIQSSYGETVPARSEEEPVPKRRNEIDEPDNSLQAADSTARPLKAVVLVIVIGLLIVIFLSMLR